MSSSALPSSPESLNAATADSGAADSARMEWWRDAKFGIFIHWGAYSAFAGRWGDLVIPWAGEWLRHTARIPRDEYAQAASAWQPRAFDAAAWAQLIRDAGAGYAVLTTKHHDGFCLWDTETTDFKLPATSGAPDVMADFSAACHAAGLKLGWYYSPRDWHHPDFLPRYEELEPTPEGQTRIGFKASPIVGPNDCPDGSPDVSGRPFVDAPPPADGRQVQRYYAYLRRQLVELTTRYGTVDILWFDGQDARPDFFPADEIVRELRGRQPGIIINDRLGMPPWTADFGIHENVIPGTGETRDWESCDTMNYTWGYTHDWTEWHTPRKHIHDLCDIVAKGGNYLLNIGPDGDGRVPAGCAERLREIGRWLARFGEAIRGTRRAEQASDQPGVRFTRRGDALYVLQLADPGADLWLGELELKPGGRAVYLGDGREVRAENTGKRGLRLRVAELPLASWAGEVALAFRLEGAVFRTASGG